MGGMRRIRWCDWRGRREVVILNPGREATRRNGRCRKFCYLTQFGLAKGQTIILQCSKSICNRFRCITPIWRRSIYGE